MRQLLSTYILVKDVMLVHDAGTCPSSKLLERYSDFNAASVPHVLGNVPVSRLDRASRLLNRQLPHDAGSSPVNELLDSVRSDSRGISDQDNGSVPSSRLFPSVTSRSDELPVPHVGGSEPDNSLLSA